MSLDRFTNVTKSKKQNISTSSKKQSTNEKTRIFSPKSKNLALNVFMDKSYTKLGLQVKCPRCGKEGELYLRRVKGNFYIYILHGRVQHYLGRLPFNPLVDKEAFELWLANIQSARFVTIKIPEQVYDVLLDYAKHNKMSLDEYIIYLINEALKEDTKYIDTLNKIIESMKKR